MRRLTTILTLALFLLTTCLLFADNSWLKLWENTRQTLSTAQPELFLVHPTQGILDAQGAVLRFNVAQIHLKDGDAPFRGFSIKATFTDAEGKFHNFSAKLSQGHMVEFALPDLPPGRSTLVAKLFRGKRKDAVCTLNTTLTVKTKEETVLPGECHIDKFGRTIVDGKPFLPIGIYFGGVDEDDDLELFLDSDFNCMMPYSSPTLQLKGTTLEGAIPRVTEFLDYLNANGKKIIFSVKDVFEIKATKTACESFQEHFGGDTPDETIAVIVDAFRGHPALLAWYDNDEIKLHDRELVNSRRQLLNRMDPNHPTWGVLDDYAVAPLFASSCDVIGVDPYPFERQTPADQERCVDAMDAVERSGQSCWAVPQTFNWGNYRARKDPGCYNKYRMPTLEQMRGVILYEALRGARGFVCYCFYDLKRIAPYTNCPPDNREPFLQRWGDVKQLATMLKSLEPWLLAEKPPVPVKLDIQKGRAEAASFADAEGKPLYILANIGPDDLDATLLLPEGTPQMKALYSHATETAPGTWHFTGNDVWGEVLVPTEGQ